MKSLHLYIALLFAIFAFQAQSLRLTKTQESLSFQSGNQGSSSRFGFKELLKAAYEAKDSTQAVSNVFRFFIEGTTYFNYIQSLFCEANTEGGEFITLEQYYSITDDQGIHRSDAKRVAGYISGVFGTPEDKDGDLQIDSFSFNQAVDLLFSESLSFITFSYITKTAQHTRHVTVTREEILKALVEIFNLFKDTFPLPDCDELGYLFKQCDTDKDGELNLQEFHYFLTIYLRYYKYGIQSNRFAAAVMKDKVFDYVFDNQEGLGGKTDRTKFLALAFKRFLQITISDKSLNQMSHLMFTKFDSDGSGEIDPKEFSALLAFFHAPLDEVDVLFAAADTDGSGQIDFSEFVVTLTTLLRKLVADFAFNLLKETGASANVDDTYAIFKNVEKEEGERFITADKFKEIWVSVDKYGDSDLEEEEFAIVISEVIAYIRTKSRISEEAEISAVAGIDVDDTTAEEVIAIKEEASEQVSDIIYGINEGLGIEDEGDYYEVPFEEKPIIDQIEEETGYTVEEINEIVEENLGGSVTIEQVIETVAESTTEEIIEAVATVAVEEISQTDCPTEEAIQEAIETALESGVIDAVVTEVENLSTEEILETVEEVVTSTQITEQVTETIQLDGGVETDDIIEAVEDNTGAQLAVEDIVEIVGEASGAETVEEVLEVIENSTTEEIIETVTEAVQEEDHSLSETIVEAQYQVAVTEVIEDQTGLSSEEVEAAVEEQTGGSIGDVIEAATGVATEQLVDVIVEAAIEDAQGTDCPTVESIQETIEEVIENGAVEEIIENIQEATPEEVIETVEEAIEDQVAASDEEEATTIVVEETIEETGYTGDEINEIVEEQTGGATLEEVVEAAETIATEQVIEAVTEAVIEAADESDCPTEEAIQEAIEEVIEGGAVDDIVETIQESSAEEVIEAVTEVILPESDSSDSSDSEDEIEEYSEPDDIVEVTIEETGYTGDEINEIVEEQTGGASIDEVIDAAETIATEQVIEAVTEAVIEAAVESDCPTEEAIQDAIEEVIEGGAVDDIVETIESASSEEVLEAVTEVAVEQHEEAVEEYHEQVVEQIAEETGVSGEELTEIIEEQTGGATVEEVIEAAETVAAEEVIDAVAEAVIEGASYTDCPTEEGVHEAIQDAIQGGVVDDVVAQIENSSPEATIEVITEAIEGSDSEDIVEESSYLQLSSHKRHHRKGLLRGKGKM